MMMMIQPTPDGGRRITGNLPHAAFDVVVSQDITEAVILAPDGRVAGTATVKIQTPDTYKPAPRMKPAKHHSRPKTRPHIAPPGTWVAAVIFVATLGKVVPCLTCKSRASAMDQAGWRGMPGLLGGWAIRRWLVPMSRILTKRHATKTRADGGAHLG